MKILRPQKILFNNLKKINNLLDEIKNSHELNNIIIEDYKERDIEITDIEVEKAILNNTEIINGNLQNNTFIDVEFNNCNFSNTSFENNCFIRCEFNNCKLTGCNFTESRMYNVSYIETNLCYSNFSMASIENVFFDNTCLKNSSFQENKLKDIIFRQADLTQVQFFKTSLKEIDFSDSKIEGMAVSLEDIKGAIINEFQVIDLLYLLGVKLK